MKNNMLSIIIFIMKTKCSLIIYNKAIGYVSLKAIHIYVTSKRQFILHVIIEQ